MSDAERRSYLSDGTRTGDALETALPFGRRISARYMGDDLAERYARATPSPANCWFG